MRVSSVSKTCGYTHVKKMTEIKGISGSRFGENTLWTHNLHLSDSTVGRLPWLQHERTCNTKKKSRNKQTSNMFYEKNMSSARHHIFWYLGKAKRTSQQTVNWFYEQNKSSARQWRHHNFWYYIPLTSISLPSVLMRRFLKDVITTRPISCLFLNLDIFIKNSIPERFVCFWHI